MESQSTDVGSNPASGTKYFDEQEAHHLIVSISADVKYVENLMMQLTSNCVDCLWDITEERNEFKAYFYKLYAYIDRLGGIITLPHK